MKFEQPPNLQKLRKRKTSITNCQRDMLFQNASDYPRKTARSSSAIFTLNSIKLINLDPKYEQASISNQISIFGILI